MSADDMARLRTQIATIGVRPGVRLPPEPELGAMLGIPRSRLRTLLQRLEDEGLIWRHVGKGTFVGPRDVSAGAAGLAAASPGDLFDARLLIEPQLAREAALRARRDDLAILHGCLSDMEASADFVVWKQIDDRLHRSIAVATQNPLLLLMHDTLRAHATGAITMRMNDVFGDPAGLRGRTQHEHRRIVAAIERHDPAAAEVAMRDHLSSVRGAVFETKAQD